MWSQLGRLSLGAVALVPMADDTATETPSAGGGPGDGALPGVAALGDGMLDSLAGFVTELRTAGIPVSLTENLDAMEALLHVPHGGPGRRSSTPWPPPW